MDLVCYFVLVVVGGCRGVSFFSFGLEKKACKVYFSAVYCLTEVCFGFNNLYLFN